MFSALFFIKVTNYANYVSGLGSYNILEQDGGKEVS